LFFTGFNELAVVHKIAMDTGIAEIASALNLMMKKRHTNIGNSQHSSTAAVIVNNKYYLVGFSGCDYEPNVGTTRVI